MALEMGSSTKYDSGINPAIAMNARTTLEVHKSEGNNGLWYHLGEPGGGFGDSRKYDAGWQPFVAMNLEVTLAAAIGGGYLWRVLPFAEGVVVVEPTDHVRAGQAIGGAQSQRLNFRAVATGEVSLQLILGRPWEGDDAAMRRLSLEVVVA